MMEFIIQVNKEDLNDVEKVTVKVDFEGCSVKDIRTFVAVAEGMLNLTAKSQIGERLAKVEGLMGEPLPTP
jgi:hypothetical protein